jgi:2,4-dienoyl-CoA reductase-like NADH-dependent reductase (Old Yellow Enzyme family)
MVLVGSAFSYLRQYAGNYAAGLVQEKKVDICGFGRMAIANPEFAKQILLKGMIEKSKTCITCSKCSEFMKLGKNTGCAVRDPLYQ